MNNPAAPGVYRVKWRYTLPSSTKAYYWTDAIWTGEEWRGFEGEKPDKDTEVVDFVFLRREV